MAKRFFTADFHLGMSECIRFEKRPFKNVQEMNSRLVHTCMERTTENDIIYHIGDLASWKSDRGNLGLDVKPMEIVKTIPAQFLNIRGNHDLNNKVTSVCEAMHVHLSRRYPDVVCCHYPSFTDHALKYVQPNGIWICGHVHRSWRHCLDLTNNILNVNVGVDAWNYNIVSEDELTTYLDSLFRLQPDDLLRARRQPNGKMMYFKPKSLHIS